MEEEGLLRTPPEIWELAETTTQNLLPDKSETAYKKQFKKFEDWRKENNIQTISENEEEKKPLLPMECFFASNHPQASVTLEPQFPPGQPQNISTEEYPGPFDFEVLIAPSEQRTPWEYSTKLNKIFIGINLKFPVAFSVPFRPPNLDLYVRATPVFTQSQFFQEIVHRCVAHQHPHDLSNKGLRTHIFQHIMRCSNDRTQYFGDKNKGERLNIVTPLAKPQAGTDVIKEFYHFVCKNSCPLGMNRRPINIVFTLEDEEGEVLGRRVVSVRICSCPKRDKEKEEKDAEKTHPRQGKKRKLQNVENERREEMSGDAKKFQLNINIVGRSNYLHVLTTIRDRMAAEILKIEGQNDSPFEKCYNEVCSLIEKTKAE